MTYLIYYSNFCKHSKEILEYLAKNGFTGLKYLCIDKRFVQNNNTYIINNNQPIILPREVTQVPAMLLLDENREFIFGKEILKFFNKKQKSLIKDATNNDEPNSFSLRSSFGNSITSDAYSYLDMGSDELSAQGSGGIRQMHDYASINYEDKIHTPDESYSSDKLGEEVSIGKLQEQREKDIPKPPLKI